MNKLDPEKELDTLLNILTEISNTDPDNHSKFLNTNFEIIRFIERIHNMGKKEGYKKGFDFKFANKLCKN